MSEPTSDKKASPRWNLDSIFPGFDSDEYKSAKKRLASVAAESLVHLELALVSFAGGFGAWLARALDLNNEANALSRTLSAYCYANYSTDTGDKIAMAELNSVDEIALPFAKAQVLFLNALAANADAVREAIAQNPDIMPFAFYLEDALFWQTRQMGAAEEDLAADLARSGCDAWGRLQEQLTSTADCLWDEKTGERKTLVELRSLAYDTDRAVREKAYRKELEVCRGISLPVAASLNGVKGSAIALNGRRHWAGNDTVDPALEKSVKQGHLSAKALSALIAAMEESLPDWRRYLKAKASFMNVPACAFYDLFAPLGGQFPNYSWEEVRSTVIDNFSLFSPSMGAFAKKAFDSQWIDAESRSGKVGGAYCTDMPLKKETRVLCNFDGSFNTVTTVAHELGHAFHSYVLKDLPPLQQEYPMTLAETASIFAETVVFEAELAKANPDARLGLLEVHLQDGCQILCDILSRFYFEQAVFAGRKEGELTADDFCASMIDAQKRTYGDGLDGELLHPFMWLVKCHYYSSDLAFYNYPYAFGQLFALALYARYRKEGQSFAGTYENILLETARMDAVELTVKAGFDIESIDFWRSGIGVFVAQIDEFEKLVALHATTAPTVNRSIHS